MPAISAIRLETRSCSPVARLMRYAAVTAVAAAAALAVVLLWRRVSGTLTQPLAVGPSLAVAAALVAAAALVRVLWRQSAIRPETRWQRWAARATPSALVLLMAVAVWLPGGTVAARTAFWAVLLAGEAAQWWLLLRRWTPRTAAGRPAATLPTIEPAAASRSLTGDHEALPPDNVEQQLTRARDRDGAEVVFGLLRGRFAPQQRALNLHVAFCPPMESTPQVEVHQIDGPEIKLKLAEVMPYGARIELRQVRADAQPQSVLLEMHAAGSIET